ncbi:hypothetical protein BDZ91DRAFT_754294 [Kalaharituber pfeilii]|nr:hypothetical protein BDZ91DRAFT_754294 [Kalaharituber pfeilii]
MCLRDLFKKERFLLFFLRRTFSAFVGCLVFHLRLSLSFLSFIFTVLFVYLALPKPMVSGKALSVLPTIANTSQVTDHQVGICASARNWDGNALFFAPQAVKYKHEKKANTARQFYSILP